MPCHICQAEAVTRCYQCGELVCAQHGGKSDLCSHCSTGFTTGDPRGVSVVPLVKEQHDGWWRPRQADEFQPPACYSCKGLTRAVCRNCQSKYCRDHAGPNGLCKDCGRSANLGLYVFAGMILLTVFLYLIHWLFYA